MKKEIDKRFFQEIESIRIKHSLKSYSELCELAGISSKSLSNIKTGLRSVTLDMLKAVYNKFGLDINFVLTGKKQESKSTQIALLERELEVIIEATKRIENQLKQINK